MVQLQPRRIDRSDLLTNPMFWAVHSFEQTRADNWIEEFFGFSPNDIKAFWQKQFSSLLPGEPHLFPCYCFLLPLRNGCSASVEYEAYPEDFGIAYYIHHPSWESPVLLSRCPNAYDWPPFRWEEAVALAEVVEAGKENDPIRLASLPLLFPGVWLTSNDNLDHVHVKLRSAWADLHVVKPTHLAGMAATMVGAKGILEPWRHDPHLGWVNSGRNYRNPQHSAPAFFVHVNEFFAATCGTNNV